MKELVFSLLCIVSIATYAQEDEPKEEPQDSTETYSIGDEIDVEFDFDFETDTTKNLQTRWITFGLGLNPVLADGSFDLPSTSQFYDDWDEMRVGNSVNVNLGLVNQQLNLVDHKLNLRWGLGLDMYDFSFDSNFRIDPDANTWLAPELNPDPGSKKNKLKTTYLSVPIMLNYESSTKHYKSFRLSAGGFAGLRLNSRQKIKFKDRDDNPFDDKQIYKERDNFGMNTFTYGLAAEVGYGPVNIYTRYHLQDLFEDDFGPELNTMSIGLMIVPF